MDVVPDLETLVTKALAAQQHEMVGSWGTKNQALQSLIDSSSAEVFDAAERLCTSSDRNERLLGVRVLRELGRPETPFGDQSVDLIVRLVNAETDVEVLRWEVSALGFQRRIAALPTILALVDHPDPGVRDAVAGAISGAQSSDLDDLSVEALAQLAHDPDDDVRFSAVFELASWLEVGVSNSRVRAELERAALDADPRISSAAVGALGGGRGSGRETDT